ncbi:MAG: ABC transporter permease [Clostridia bacterium]|nr:ABC transporter permease [Clostridia bacterium]
MTTQFFALLRLQLLSRFADWKPRNMKARLGEKKGKAIGRAALFAVLVIYLAGILIFVENALLNVLIQLDMPDLLLSVATICGMLSTLVLAFFFILSTLYFDRDAAFIASLPVKPRTVLSAKLVQIWLSETGVAALFILPACILYGIRLRPDALFYLRAILVWAAIAVLPMVIVAFLSTLLIRLSSLWKRREMVATVGGIALLIAYMILCMNLGSVAGDDAEAYLMQFLTSNLSRIESITRLFPPAAWAARGLLGDWGQLALFLLVCAGATALTIGVIGCWYHDLSLLQNDQAASTSRRRGKTAAAYHGASAFRACCQREIRQIFRVPAYATNILPISFMPVLMVGVMAMTLSRSMEEGETIGLILEGVGGGTVLAVMAALMAFMAGMNPALSSAVTREGKGHELLTVLPVPSRTIALAKLTVGMALSLIGCLPAAVILAVLVPGHGVHALLAFIATGLYSFISGCLALINDIRHPKFDWLTETEAIKQKSGTLIGMLISWALLAALGVGSFLLLSHGASTTVYAAALIGVLALVAVPVYRLLMNTADQKYWQG